jgi:hypothetical protein
MAPMLALVSKRAGNEEIFVMSLEGGKGGRPD